MTYSIEVLAYRSRSRKRVSKRTNKKNIPFEIGGMFTSSVLEVEMMVNTHEGLEEDITGGNLMDMTHKTERYEREHVRKIEKMLLYYQ